MTRKRDYLIKNVQNELVPKRHKSANIAITGKNKSRYHDSYNNFPSSCSDESNGDLDDSDYFCENNNFNGNNRPGLFNSPFNDSDQSNPSNDYPRRYKELNCNKSSKTSIIEIDDRSYKINYKKILGKGSFSIVYSGMRISTKEKVAIKKIFVNKLTKIGSQVIEREIKTINKLIKLSNPCKNIVTYYDVIKNHSCIFIIMELSPYGTFSSLLIKPLKEHYSKFYFNQIIHGLKTLHDIGILHKDIKPDNILIFDDYRTIKLCDFGFSQNINNDCDCDNNNDSDYESESESESDDTICGSPIYMAPELFESSGVRSNVLKNIGSDLWSAGIILYEMVYGSNPHSGSKDIKSIKQAVSTPIKITEVSWIDLTINGIDLLKQILNPDSNSRITINDVTKNVWLTQNNNIKDIVLSDLFYTTHTIIKTNKSIPDNFVIKNNKVNQIMNCGIFDNIIKKHNNVSVTRYLPSDEINYCDKIYDNKTPMVSVEYDDLFFVE
jgi:serine/threonine protein kinase